MYEYGVGVRTRRTLDVKRVDEAYFEGDVSQTPRVGVGTLVWRQAELPQQSVCQQPSTFATDRIAEELAPS